MSASIQSGFEERYRAGPPPPWDIGPSRLDDRGALAWLGTFTRL